ncbi:MAG: hypothetical protein GTO12_24720 [Proteobacteria bacterium]|nr:hypothetical protein [Pseudomonadota bacterium]
MDKRKYFVFILSIIFLLPVLLGGCAQATETHPPGLLTSTPAEQTVSLVEYRDTKRGFSFSLPASWKGFSIIASNWEGLKSGDSGDEVVEQGSIVSIVHPKSTTEQPRQDIPIMVFTIEQWDRMQRGEWHVGAAPIGPLELGRNSRYVFALPARYNYAFLEGWEEVEQILQDHPLVTFEPDLVP